MKLLNNRYTAVGVALVSSFLAGAQGLDQTVTVTKTYEGKLIDAYKPAQTMPVPDSLTKFDLDFDYSVFENPYNGAYDFRPYSMQMVPETRQRSQKFMYLKAGAGYNLRPSVDFVLEPGLKGLFRMSVYASHHSYIGNYRNIGFGKAGKLTGIGGKWSGYDLYSTAGVEGQANFSKTMLAFDVNYMGIHTKDGNALAGAVASSGYNALNVSARVKSENDASEYLFYDVAAKYRYSVQGMGGLTVSGGDQSAGSLDMNDLDLGVTIGPVFSKYNRIVADIGLGMTWYEGIAGSYTGNYYIAPKYILDEYKWKLSLGVKFCQKLSSGADFLGSKLNTNNGILLYPDVYVGYMAAEDYMNLYFTARGGEYRNSYSSLKEKNHFFTPIFSGKMTNNTVTRYDLALGFNGNIRQRFRYDFHVGYASYEAVPLDCVFSKIDEEEQISGVGLSYEDYRNFYSDILMQWESRDITFDAGLRINAVGGAKDVEEGLFVFSPAMFSGTLKATYNWNRRIFAGLSADFSSRRTLLGGADTMYIPAWVDLGVHAEYVFSRKMSFWIRGENLLNMKVQRHPLYTAGGVGFTAGICLSL